MISIHFEIDGKKVIRALDASAANIKDFSEPLNEIGSTLLKTFDLNFSTRGRTYGGWAPRKPRYRGGERIDTWPLMEKTGRLRRGFKKNVTITAAKLSNPVPYFPYHQRGGSRLPQRLLMTLRAQDGQMITKTFQAYVIKVLRTQGLR